MSNEANIILGLLSSDSMVTHSKLIAHAIGLNEAVAYASLIAKSAYYERNNLLDDDGYFYCTINDLQESTALTRDQQEKVIKKLVKLGLISYKRKGLPAKRFFKLTVDVDKVKEIIDIGIKKSNELKQYKCKQHTANKIAENPQTRCRKTRKQDTGKSVNKMSENPQQNINNININKQNISNKNNTTNNSDTKQIIQNEVYDLYLQEICRDKLGLSALTIDCLKRLISEYGGEKVVEAIKISVYQNKRSLRYIEGVLKKQKKEGEASVKPKGDTKQEIDWSKFD